MMVTKRQHYVPQFLLRNFASTGNKIFVFDKQNEEIRQQSISNVALGKHFYDYIDNGQKHTLENDLARLESDASSILNKFTSSTALKNISASDKKVILFFIVIQHFRTLQNRLYSKNLWNVLENAVKNEEFSKTWFANLEDHWDKVLVNFVEHQINSMKLQAPFFMTLMENYEWFLLKPATGHIFLISDNPVAVWNSSDSPDVGLGFTLDGAEIYLPIAPNLMLLLINPNCMKIGMGDITIKTQTALPMILENKVMRLINGFQVIFSDRFVFSVKNDFKLASEMLASNPEWREGPKPEIDEVIEFLRFISNPVA
jgi:hypothetical protein